MSTELDALKMRVKRQSDTIASMEKELEHLRASNDAYARAVIALQEKIALHDRFRSYSQNRMASNTPSE